MLPPAPSLHMAMLSERQACAETLKDSSGKSFYGDFRVPDQAAVWGGEKVRTHRQAIRYFRKCPAVKSLFWIVPRSEVGDVFLFLMDDASRIHRKIPAPGLIAAWEMAMGSSDEEARDELLVGWVGPEAWLPAWEKKLGDKGWDCDEEGVRSLRFAPSSKSVASLMGDERWEELSEHEQQLVRSALSSHAEDRLLVGLGSHVPEFLFVAFALFVMLVGAVLVYPYVRDGNLINTEGARVEALVRNVQKLAKNTGVTEGTAIQGALSDEKADLVFPGEMVSASGKQSSGLSAWGTPVLVRPELSRPGFEVVYSDVPSHLCMRWVVQAIEAFKTIRVFIGEHVYEVAEDGKMNPGLLAKACSGQKSTVVLSNARDRRGLAAP